MTERQRQSVVEKIQAPAHAYGVKRLAAELNKAPSTVYSELNPWGDRSKFKLGLEDALEIMSLMRDFSGLVEACAQLGLVVVMQAPVADKDTVEKEKADDIRALADFHAAIANGASEVEVRTLAGQVKDEIMETLDIYGRTRDGGRDGSE